MSNVASPCCTGFDSLSMSNFSDCLKFKNVYFRNNEVSLIEDMWQIFHKSLRTLDLRYNKISTIYVSTIFYKIENHLW